MSLVDFALPCATEPNMKAREILLASGDNRSRSTSARPAVFLKMAASFFVDWAVTGGLAANLIACRRAQEEPSFCERLQLAME